MTELSYDKLKNMSIEEIYNYLQKEYTNIYKEYNLDVTKINPDYKVSNVKPEKKKEEKHHRKLKTIYEMIPNYSKEEINKAIELLSASDKKIFYLRNGNDLDNSVNAYEDIVNLNYLYNLVVKKIRKSLNSSHKIKTIYEYFNTYSKEEIDKAIDLLSDNDKKIIFYRYGSDLEHPFTSPMWNSAKYHGTLYVTIFKRITKNVENIHRNKSTKKEISTKKMTNRIKSIYEQLSDYSKEEIDAEIDRLSEEDKKIIYLRNGQDLAHPKLSPEFTIEQRKQYYNIVYLIKRHLESPVKYIKGTIFYQLYNLNPNFTKEDYLRAISLLSAEEKILLWLDMVLILIN